MSREADDTKKRRIALGRFYSFGVLLVLAFMAGGPDLNPVPG